MNTFFCTYMNIIQFDHTVLDNPEIGIVFVLVLFVLFLLIYENRRFNKLKQDSNKTIADVKDECRGIEYTLSQEKASLLSQIKTEQTKNSRLSQLVAEQTDQLKVASATITCNNKEIEDSLSTIKSLNAKIDQLQQELINKDTIITEREDNLKEVNARIAKLEQDIKDQETRKMSNLFERLADW